MRVCCAITSTDSKSLLQNARILSRKVCLSAEAKKRDWPIRPGTCCGYILNESVFQTPDWDNQDSVFAAVGILAGSNKNHKKRWLIFAIFICAVNIVQIFDIQYYNKISFGSLKIFHSGV